MNKYIVEKYSSYEAKEIQSGYRCQTFLLKKKENKYIYQVYFDETKYQAEKKKYITELIKKSVDIPEIPNIIEYGERDEFAYLVTEYKEGVELDKTDRDIINYKKFYESLANILIKIHQVDIGQKFGWIGKNGLEGKEFFYEYIENEIKRNVKKIQDIIGSENDIVKEINEKADRVLNEIKKINDSKPVLSWYDINPNNILVDEKGTIKGFLDAGGARFASKEWELAFIKMDLCRDKQEFEYFKKVYSRKNSINEKLLNLLTVIVEIDDIAFQLETNTKLPISFASNFKEILNQIQYSMESE